MSSAAGHVDRIAEIAARYRRAILDSSPHLVELGVMNNFPAGACGQACLLLGEHLWSRGQGLWRLASGMRPGEGPIVTHSWLVRDGLVVDITADQFDDVDTPVVVTLDDAWYQPWDRLGSRWARLDGTSGQDTPSLRQAYDHIDAVLTGGRAG
ncbi:hypothetical protein Cs7R123_31880 [Catellatospora sp. TT07R-123]|uniref:hypothetical protein n=1 Tax=Catellatospora sp. TT07R-123 TaxID=2733863 RepID=UPI001B2CB5F3|nr:hypothetical protein [Catellatospora sp. TT07R-123]GHJ45846.1 hypothetical protein Cs7R123_31880 [Catellatospora sp. TT07R-123]